MVLKGIDHGDGKIVNYVASASTGVAGKIELAHEKLPYMIHGTGDAFASALCGAACERYNRIFLWDMFPYEIICSYLDDSITLDDALSFMDENLSKSLARLQ